MLYADDIVLIAKSGQLVFKFSIFLNGISIVRNAFLTMCAVISSDSAPKRLYGAPLPSVKSSVTLELTSQPLEYIVRPSTDFTKKVALA